MAQTLTCYQSLFAVVDVQASGTHRTNFEERYLKSALQAGLLEPTIPGKPSSRLQKYCLIPRGPVLLKS